jgi:hypothetical protein
MKLSKIVFIILIAVSICFCANHNQANEKLIKADEINSKYIEQYRFSVFVMRFSNIIFEEKGEKIKIPIFQGKYGDVENKDIIEYCIKNKYIDKDIWLRYIIKCKKGEIKKTFHEFLAFYKSNILKNIDLNDPKAIELSSDYWFITYDFIIDGIPCYLEIRIRARDEDLQSTHVVCQSAYDIKPNEKMKEPSFTYLFIIGAKSKK